MAKRSATKRQAAGWLALADGTVYRGTAHGAIRGTGDAAIGEVVFNTSLMGYQEILTDPSYAGQIMTFTTPHIGNVGCNREDDESSKVHVEGVLCRQMSPVSSNFRAEESLDRYLEEAGTLCISGIDTREIVRGLRDNGSQMGAMAAGDAVNPDELVHLARSAGSMLGKEYVSTVSCVEPYSWNLLPWSHETNRRRELPQERLTGRPHVVAVDCGVKRNILSLLVEAGFRVTVVPANSTAEQIQQHAPDALFLSNGPGDPATLDFVVRPVKELLGKLPIFGICLGHQILAQAVGASTYKLKFGHRGGNHPVRVNRTGQVDITVQNHGFAVAADSVPSGVEITHINLNDQTVEGLEVPGARAFSIQYHPEASPGPHDARYLFKQFFQYVVEGRS
jgi:carbamoyl-phosphate synthase small subunit